MFSQKNTSFYINHLNPSNYKKPVYTTYLCVFTQKLPKILLCFFHKTLHFKNPQVFSQKHYISYQKHLNLSNYKTCLYNLFVYLYTKKYQRPSCVFSQKHYISYQKHLNPSNYKTCLYYLFVYLYTKNTKDHPVFFHKNTTFHIRNT